MIISDIYKSQLLKYPLNDKEAEMIEYVWDFLKVFKRRFIFISDYRRHVIKKIRKKYSLDEFFILESILNKIFWNLRWLLAPIFQNKNISRVEYDRIVKNNYGGMTELPYSLTLCHFEEYQDDDDLKKKLKKSEIFDSVFYRSFINKLIIVDKKNKVIITKLIEGSPDIFSKNYFNLLTMSILYKRKHYEKIIADPYSIKNYNIPLAQFYYEYDYPFPNLNFCTYQFGNDADRIDRIRKMYFAGKPKAKFWFKLII